MSDSVHCGPFNTSDSIGLHVRSGISPFPEADAELGKLFAKENGHLGYRHPSGTVYTLTPPSGGGSGSGVELQFNGLPLGTADTLNFSGAGVNVLLDGTTGHIFVEGGSSSSTVGLISGIELQDEGTVLGKVTKINFSGEGVISHRVGDVATVIVPRSTSGIEVRDEGVVLGQFNQINFSGEGVTAQRVGDVATVIVPRSISGIELQDEGNSLGSISVVNFSGTGVTSQRVGNVGTVIITAFDASTVRSGIQVDDEGLSLGNTLDLNFSGPGVQAIRQGDVVTVIVQQYVSGIEVQDESVVLGNVAKLNFSGAGVVLQRVGDVGTVIVPRSVSGIEIQDEGSVLGQFNQINFSGSAVVATLIGNTATVLVTQPSVPSIAGLISGIEVQDEGNVLGGVTKLNFSGEGIIAQKVGDVATVIVQKSISGIELQDESVVFGAITKLNFSGDGVTSQRVGDVGTVIIPRSTSGIELQDEGNVLGAVSKLNFSGLDITATRSGDVGTILQDSKIGIYASGVSLGRSRSVDFYTSGIDEVAGSFDPSTGKSTLFHPTMPAGSIVMWPGIQAPVGWHICDGTSLSAAVYPDLFNAITFRTTGITVAGNAQITGIPSTAGFGAGMWVSCPGFSAGGAIQSVDSSTAITLNTPADFNGTFPVTVMPYGGDGEATIFSLPSMLSRSPLGAGQGAGLSNRTLGQASGLETVGLTEGQLPSVNLNTTFTIKGNPASPPHGHDTTGFAGAPTGTDQSEDVSIPTGSFGNDEEHYNMHPYVVMNYIIKLH